jgi:ADP-dependent NAD(P)H-hydrate dehydratase
VDNFERVTTIPQPMPRRADAHKGDFGHVLVVGGSVGMAGAPVLAGVAALRSGAGLVTIACSEVIDFAARIEPSLMTLPIASEHEELKEGGLETILADWSDGALSETAAAEILAHRSTVLAIGPGLGRRPRTATLVQSLLRDSTKPIVLDADGLNAVVGSTALLRRKTPTIITPHPGEFASLTGKTTAEVQANRESLAVEFARSHGCLVVLKGANTVVIDGKRVFINETGNAGMATGGTGDVLTGIIAGLLAQKLEPFAAAQLGVYLHGLAGDIVAETGSMESLIASDLLTAMPTAWRRLHGR